MKDVYNEYDEKGSRPPRFGPRPKLSSNEKLSALVRDLKNNREFNEYLEDTIKRVIDRLIKEALK